MKWLLLKWIKCISQVLAFHFTTPYSCFFQRLIWNPVKYIRRNIFAKKSILYVWLGWNYASGLQNAWHGVFLGKEHDW